MNGQSHQGCIQVHIMWQRGKSWLTQKTETEEQTFFFFFFFLLAAKNALFCCSFCALFIYLF